MSGPTQGINNHRNRYRPLNPYSSSFLQKTSGPVSTMVQCFWKHSMLEANNQQRCISNNASAAMQSDMVWCGSAYPPEVLVISYAHGFDLLSSHQLWRVCLESVLHDGFRNIARRWPVLIVHPGLVLRRRLHAANMLSQVFGSFPLKNHKQKSYLKKRSFFCKALICQVRKSVDSAEPIVHS